MHGFTENYIRISAKYDPLLINEIKESHFKLTSMKKRKRDRSVLNPGKIGLMAHG